MKTTQRLAVILIILSTLALTYGGFNLTYESQQTNPGSTSLLMDDHKRVDFPVWAGGAGMMIGGLIFVFGRSPR